MSAQINTLICVQLSLICIRLSHGSTKAHATMPIGFMGSNSLALLDWGSRCLATKQENAWTHASVQLLSLTPKYLKFQSINQVQNHRYPQYLSTWSRSLLRFYKTTFLKTVVFKSYILDWLYEMIRTLTAILSWRRTRYLDAQEPLRAGL